MGVSPTINVYIDLNRDRDFGDTNEDFTARWKKLRWTVGATRPDAQIARGNTIEAVFQNADGVLNPEGGSALSGFLPGALITIETDYNSTVTRHVIGNIDLDGIEPTPYAIGVREVDVRASGAMTRLMDEEVRVPLQTNKRTDEIIQAILERVNIYPPGTFAWLLGVGSFSEMGQTTPLATGVSDYANLETGANTFAYVGDNWKADTSVYAALRDLMATERGFFFEDRDGIFTFYSRHHWHQDLQNAVDGTITDGELLYKQEPEYKYGNVRNAVTIKYHPRAVASSVGVVGSTTEAIAVDPGDSTTTRLSFDDGSGNQIGAQNVITPETPTDWTANTNEAGTGTDISNEISVTMLADANGVELIFTNAYNKKAFIRNLQVRGEKITDFGEMQEVYVDQDSIGSYERQAETITMRFLDDRETARQLARWIVSTHKDPSGLLESYTFLATSSDALMQYAINRTVGDRVLVVESWTGINDEYFIIGEEWDVESVYEIYVTHYVVPRSPQDFWLLGVTDYSEIGEASWIGV